MDENLEMYLMQVARQLRRLPPQQREAELREIESHLRSMIEAREVGGILYSDAVSGALQQFGSPRRVGRDLIHAWRKTHEESPIRSLAAALVALACQIGAGGIVFGVHFAILLGVYKAGDNIGGLTSFSNAVFLGAFYGVAPLIGGYWANRIAPRRGWWAASAAYISIMSLYHFMVSTQSSTYYPSIGAVVIALFGTLPALLGGVWFSKRKGKQASSSVIST